VLCSQWHSPPPYHRHCLPRFAGPKDLSNPFAHRTSSALYLWTTWQERSQPWLQCIRCWRQDRRWTLPKGISFLSANRLPFLIMWTFSRLLTAWYKVALSWARSLMDIRRLSLRYNTAAPQLWSKSPHWLVNRLLDRPLWPHPSS